MRLPVGTRVGEYEIQRLIGQGTFGTVYQAVHPVIGKRGAVKVLRYDALDDADTVQRFKGEAQAVNAIEHPNIVDIFSFGHLHDGRPYLIMEYLDGCSLEELLDQSGGRLPAETVLPILQEVALAVDAAHEAGVVHRDLKPDNIFISRTASGVQVVKVLDFGVAKLMFQSLTATDPGMPMGTPLYMAPEQCLNEREIDYRIDVYGFGVTAFYCLTGDFPVDADSYAGIVKHHLTGERRLASEIDPQLGHFDAALHSCLTVAPEERFQSLQAAYEALAGAYHGPAYSPATGPVPPVAAAGKSSKHMTLMGPLAAQRARERAASAPVPQPLGRDMQPVDMRPPTGPPMRAPSSPVPPPAPLTGPVPGPVPGPVSGPVPGPAGRAPSASTPIAHATPAVPTGLVPPPDPGRAAQPSPTPAGFAHSPGGGSSTRSTLDSSSAELLSQYKLRRPLLKTLLFAAIAVAVVVGVVMIWPALTPDDQGRSSAPASDALEEAVTALNAKRWDDALAAAERVLASDPAHAQARHIQEQARQEADSQEQFRILLVAAEAQDMLTAKDSLLVIPGFSVYASEAQRVFTTAADKWLADQMATLRDLLVGRKPSKKDCTTARRLVREVGEIRAEDRKRAARIYRQSRCRQKISTSRKSSDTPSELVENALKAAKDKNYGQAFQLCQRALDGSPRTSRSHALAMCTTVACKANEAATARTWYRRVPRSSAHAKNARKSCQRAGVEL